MHCPKCGDKLDDDPRVGCRRGGMPISPSLLERLHAITDNGPPTTAPVELPFRIGGTWFCPACGVLAEEPRQGVLQCSRCRRSFSDIVHVLTETHPHEKLCVLSCTFEGVLSDDDIATIFLEGLGVNGHLANGTWRGTAIGGWSFEFSRGTGTTSPHGSSRELTVRPGIPVTGATQNLRRFRT